MPASKRAKRINRRAKPRGRRTVRSGQRRGTHSPGSSGWTAPIGSTVPRVM